MANLQSTCIVGTLTLGTSANTSAAGFVWYNTSINRLQYSRFDGSSIVACTP